MPSLLAVLVVSVTIGLSTAYPLSREEARQLPIGAQVIDTNGEPVEKTGNLSCWTSQGPGGEYLDEPIKSLPVFKYCNYQVPTEGNLKPACWGWPYDPTEDEYIDFTFARNPNISLFLFEEVFMLSTPYQVSLKYICRLNLCNIPSNLESFVAFNYRLSGIPMSEDRTELTR